jgi:hypothetical protein
MTPRVSPAPPRLAEALLHRLLPPDGLEIFEGDMSELFAQRVREHGIRYARARYWRDAVSVLVRRRRPTPSRQAAAARDTSVLRLTRYLRHSLRSLTRERPFSLAASLTLAIGIGATTIVFTVVQALLSQPEFSQGRRQSRHGVGHEPRRRAAAQDAAALNWNRSRRGRDVYFSVIRTCARIQGWMQH